jgi:hypothetical protein
MEEHKVYIEIDSDLFDKIKNISGSDYDEIRTDEKILVDNKHIIYMLDDLLNELDYQKERFEEKENQFKTMYSNEGLLTRISALEGALNIKRNN